MPYTTTTVKESASPAAIIHTVDAGGGVLIGAGSQLPTIARMEISIESIVAMAKVKIREVYNEYRQRAEKQYARAAAAHQKQEAALVALGEKAVKAHRASDKARNLALALAAFTGRRYEAAFVGENWGRGYNKKIDARPNLNMEDEKIHGLTIVAAADAAGNPECDSVAEREESLPFTPAMKAGRRELERLSAAAAAVSAHLEGIKKLLMHLPECCERVQADIVVVILEGTPVTGAMMLRIIEKNIDDIIKKLAAADKEMANTLME